MAAPLRPADVPAAAAKLRVAASSVAPVASGYERSLRNCPACFSPIGDALGTERDR
jgi:hypothetical protein